MDKKMKIEMTDRRPVQIIKSEWPVIAQGSGDSFGGNDGARHQQALLQGELDEYRITVRQHADGRSIVYGGLSAGWSGNQSWTAGYLLNPGADITQYIYKVAGVCSIPHVIAHECITNLPAENL